MPGKWVRLKHCPVCDHDGYCTRTADGEVVKCQRCPSDHPIKQKDGTTAWVHRVKDLGNGTRLKPAKLEKERPRLTVTEIRALLKRHQADLTQRRLEILSTNLGVSQFSLRAFGCGFDVETQCYSFPMVEPFEGKTRPCGIHLRPLKGDKRAVVGSRNGLFVPIDYEAFAIPADIADDPFPLLILTPEGLSDAATARDCGFRSIGRPSATSGGPMLRQLFIDGKHPPEVVIIADRDETKYLRDGTPFWPGLEGAISICQQIHDVCGRLWFWQPPEGIKDLRQWMREGGKEKLGADPWVSCRVTEKWLKAAWARLEQRKRTEKRDVAA